MISSSKVLHLTALAGASLAVLLSPQGLQAQVQIEGQVLNGTSRRAAARTKVLLLSPRPREGMQLVATAMTDSEGRFIFSQSDLDRNSLYLLQVNAQDVPYHAPVEFDSMGSAKVVVTIYDSTRSASSLRVRLLRILARAEGQKVVVLQEYEVENKSAPPRAYANPGGTFAFRLSPQASEPAVAVIGLMNIPLPQSLERGRSAGEYAIRYPMKPGVTQVTVTYGADYAQRQIALSDRVSYPVDRVELFVFPSNLSLDSSIFKPVGFDATLGVQKFETSGLAPETPLDVRLSGEALPGPPPESGPAEGQIESVPDPMARLGVPLVFCFLLVLLWALGIRVSREWPRWKERRGATPVQKQLGAKADALLDSLADLDELFASGKIAEKKYRKERLELKARVMAVLKKGSPSLLESYGARRVPR